MEVQPLPDRESADICEKEYEEIEFRKQSNC